ncbi:MAG: YeeE/YedE family protein [Christensenellaceae bacterium]|nr:YeeE/YedE family protein [Christensenellaceae bacterium]
MMVKEHPMWRGLWLAAAVVLAMVLVGQADVLPAYVQASRQTGQSVPVDRFAVAMAVMIIPGAFLASLPSRLRNKEEKSDKPSGKSLLMAFLGGILLVLGLGVAGGGMAAGLLFTGVGAWVFALVAWVTAFLLIRLWGGERA